MSGPLSIGDEAPNFDLSSTEGALLMLRDEVVRTAVVLYLFTDPTSERVRADLKALSAAYERLAERQAKVLAVAPMKVEELQELQRELDLAFPLLRDDRGFLGAYGVAPAGEGEQAAPALLLVDRRQHVGWVANPAPPVEGALGDLEKALGDLATPTAGYPRKVINRLVSWWVN